MARKHKTTGDVYKTFRSIGRVGGNTVKGLIVGGRLFNILHHRGLIDPKALQEAAEEAGISPDEMDQAFEVARQARERLGFDEDEEHEVEDDETEIEIAKRATPKKRSA